MKLLIASTRVMSTFLISAPALANIDRAWHLAAFWDDGLRSLITQGRIDETEVLFRKNNPDPQLPHFNNFLMPPAN